MSRRFSMSEVKLARRIKARTNVEKAMEQENIRNESMQEAFKRITDAPMHPSYGPTPPWWEQAVAEADQGLVWVTGYGYMGRDLWDGILKAVDLDKL